METGPAPRDLFLESLRRCQDSGDFISSFYERFFAISSEIRDKFIDTDFDTQNRMLLHSLKLVAAATAGEQDGLRELRERAGTHDRHHLDIAPELYGLWRSALIDTAREFDGEWSDAIEDVWHKILGYAIDYMIKFY